METIECTTCGIITKRVFLKYRARNENKTREKHWHRKVYVDETGRQWNGRECPNCKYGSEPNEQITSTKASS